MQNNHRIKVLFVWPWFRALALNYAELLNDFEFEVKVITTSKSWDNDESNKLLKLIGPFKFKTLLTDTFSIYHAARNFNADVLFTESTSDPRFFLLRFLKFKASVLSIHDVVKHGSEDDLNVLRRISSRMASVKHDEIITFSDSSKNQIEGALKVSLLPEFPLGNISKANTNHNRKNFVTFGRIEPYKNLEWLAQNWAEISLSLGFEELHIYGSGKKDLTGVRVRHFNNRFDRNQLVSNLHHYRCAIFPYLTATQSGALLLAHVGSIASVTSDLAGFREYQPTEAEFLVNPQSKREIQEKLIPFMSNSFASMMGNSAHEIIYQLIETAETETRNLVFNLIKKYSS